MHLNNNERIDDLEYKDLKIIQRKDGFCFGIDSVLLSNYAKDIKRGTVGLDLGTGTGILGILLCGKTDLSKIYGIEVQQEVAEMAQRSVKLNNLENRFEIINKNIKDLESVFDKNSFDFIITNPPYKKMDTGKTNENSKKLISRHEITATLKDFIKISYIMLKDKGTLYMVHKPERLVDIIYQLRKNKIEPKEIRFVHPYEKKEPNLILIKAVKNGGQFLKIDKPLYVYNERGEYTEEILKYIIKCKENYNERKIIFSSYTNRKFRGYNIKSIKGIRKG